MHAGQQRVFSHFLALCAGISMLITNLNILKSCRNVLKSGVALYLPLKRKHELTLLLHRWGKSLNEIRQEIKEAEDLRLKKWSKDHERRLQEEEAATKTPPEASTNRPTPAQRKIGRKDSSPVKVTETSFLPEPILIIP